MRVYSIIATFALPLLAVAQNSTSPPASPAPSQSSNANNSVSSVPTPSPIVSVGTTIIVGFISGGRVPTTTTSTFNVTITPTPTQANGSPASNSSSASSSSSTGPLPTAPADVDGGGQTLPGGAPHPGEKSSDGRFGPPDTYISAALAHVGTLLSVVAGIAVGGTLLLA
ncbi:hypothetical protein BDW22DRAFT_44501 [Trametopsis cervina]|nr:hypothetical protein BDW22DRAFT_44501 [Trametopsis cervina]